MIPPRTTRVWKFVVPLPDQRLRSWIDAPLGSVLLSVAMQESEMVVWALVDPDAVLVRRRLIVANTGDPVEVPEGAKFLGTVTEPFLGVVWHVWDGDGDV